VGAIPKAQAVQIVAQAVLGTARTVQTEAQRTAEGGHGRTPADLIDAVCSPGGTTVAGMVALERAHQVARAVTTALGGWGLFGVELFIGDGVRGQGPDQLKGVRGIQGRAVDLRGTIMQAQQLNNGLINQAATVNIKNYTVLAV